MHKRLLLAVSAITVLGLAGCATSAAPDTASRRGVIEVVATINAWGSILAQLGGAQVHETSIITNPATDPHSYEPTPADARAISDARLIVVNGIGYDPWASQTLAASPDSHRRMINVGQLVHVPDGGNPHRWYDPSDVETVAAAITAALKQLDPAQAGYFDQRYAAFVHDGLARYHQLLTAIQTRYSGVPVGASESIVAPLAAALRLDLITPPAFLKAMSEGTDPSTADKATIDRQIATRAIAVYLYNSQNSTPDVSAQVKAARAKGISVVAVTETLSPASATFQSWQAAQLSSLLTALQTARAR